MSPRNNENDDSDFEEKRLTLIEHLDELRSRIITSLVAITVGTVIAFIFSGELIDWLIKPCIATIKETYYTSPLQPFNVRLKASFFAGMVIASPVILHQLWKFIKPALNKKEKNVVRSLFGFAIISFLVGVAFAYFVIIPMGIKALLEFGTPLMKPLIGIEEIINFVVFFLLAMGLVFEMPLVMMGLAKVGIVSSRMLSKNRKFAIVGAAVLACIVTPGSELVTSMILTIPLYLLYEISIWMVKIVNPGSPKDDEEDEFEDEEAEDTT